MPGNKSFNLLLNRFKKIYTVFDAYSAQNKVDLLSELSVAKITDPIKLTIYMDMLLFTLAHPQSNKIRMVATKEIKRISLLMKMEKFRMHESVVNSGLPFAPVRTRFSHEIIQSLLNNKKLELVFDGFEDPQLSLNEVLKLTMPSVEREITTAGMTNEELLEYLGVEAKDIPEFLVQELSKYRDKPLTMDFLFDTLSMYVKVFPKTEKLSRAFNKLNTPIDIQSEIWKRFDHISLLQTPIGNPTELSAKEKSELIETIKNSLLLTARETDPVTYMQEDSLRLYTLNRGISIAFYSMIPERQLSFESYVGFTLFKNGYPASYGGAWIFGKRMLFGINIFEPYRGGESGLILCQLLRLYKQVFGVDYIEVEPYQYGLDNPEGIQSGAYWFYYRFGFRSLDKDLAKLAEKEFGKIKTTPGYRSSEKTLVRFTESNIVLQENKEIPPTVADISSQITELIAKRYKGNRQLAIESMVNDFLTKSNINQNEYTDNEQRVLGEYACWAALQKGLNKLHYDQMVALVKLKPVDLYAYQTNLLGYFALKN